MNKIEALGWLNHAKQNLTTALHGSHQAPWQKCYDSQQTSEKALKAVLVLEGIGFKKTHDIKQLVNIIPSNWDVKNLNVNFDALTNWAIDGKYPYGLSAATQDDVNFCTNAARQIYNSIEDEFRRRGI